jgi:hypothetical protein
MTTTGWSLNEAEVLRKALMKFGVGNWSKIIESNCLVGKTNAQMNLQTQRMLGQQSTAGKPTSFFSNSLGRAAWA